MKNKILFFYSLSIAILFNLSCGTSYEENSYEKFNKKELKKNEETILKYTLDEWLIKYRESTYPDPKEEFIYVMNLNLDEKTLNKSALDASIQDINIEIWKEHNYNRLNYKYDLSDIRKMVVNNIPILEVSILGGENGFETYTCFFPFAKNCEGDYNPCCLGNMIVYKGFIQGFKYFPNFFANLLYAKPLLKKKESDFRMPTIHFASLSADLSSESKDSLNYIFNILINNPTIVCNVNGYTDSREDYYKNQILSEARAKSCVDYLVIEKGININRFRSYGNSENYLLKKDKEIEEAKSKKEKEALHQENRRVVLSTFSFDYIDLENISKNNQEDLFNMEIWTNTWDKIPNPESKNKNWLNISDKTTIKDINLYTNIHTDSSYSKITKTNGVINNVMVFREERRKKLIEEEYIRNKTGRYLIGE